MLNSNCVEIERFLPRFEIIFHYNRRKESQEMKNNKLHFPEIKKGAKLCGRAFVYLIHDPVKSNGVLAVDTVFNYLRRHLDWVLHLTN